VQLCSCAFGREHTKNKPPILMIALLLTGYSAPAEGLATLSINNCIPSSFTVSATWAIFFTLAECLVTAMPSQLTSYSAINIYRNLNGLWIRSFWDGPSQRGYRLLPWTWSSFSLEPPFTPIGRMETPPTTHTPEES
jgi:hypothetical protein